MSRSLMTVARKELREAVRDRRSLGSAVFYAVWGPGVMAIALMALARGHGPEPPLTLAMDGASQAPELAAFFTERSVTLVPAPADPAARIRERALPVVLVVDPDHRVDFNGARPARVTLLYDGSWSESSAAAGRVRGLLSDYGRRVADTRLVLRGVSPAAISALRVADQDLSTAAGRAAMVLATLPIFVLLSAFIGGMGAAADLMAGERERGSLESLLLHPVPRAAIVVGKWAAASAVCLAVMTLTLWTSQLILRHPRIQAFDVPVGLSASDAAGMWIVLAPLALAATAAQLLVALFAKTYKEAHTQLTLMIFLPMVPGFLFAFGSLDVRPWMHWLPMLGQHVMISGLLRGQPASAGAVAGLTAVTLAAALLMLALAARLLDRESIVRRAAG
ncbi:MAG TPA: ABC transporter permease subunit [Vicinamibacterales bacterium]|nr:ABC transporter permease subunit [Vicinamibacterales bacterium]